MVKTTSEASTVRLMIADDHTLFRASLRALLESRGLEVVAEAADGQQAVQLAHQLKPDIVLMDLGMPVVNGLEATRLLAAELPEVRVVILTASEEDDDLFEALKAGAQGYLPKNLESETFFDLLERAAAGEPALTPATARKVLRELAVRDRRSASPKDPTELTDREREVLEMLVSGVTSNRDLADQLGVSENTVKFHVRNILDKLQLHSRAQAVGYAVRHGLVKPEQEP